MADTDSPLKQLFSAFITDFAAWLLQADVRDAHPLNIELPAEMLAADQVFHVTLADERTLVLHIEFQGRTSHQPMEWRMLEYMTRLAYTHRLNLRSVVIYVGRGAGAGDTGRYQVNGPDGTPTLTWQYDVIRLWQMRAEELLATIPAEALPSSRREEVDQRLWWGYAELGSRRLEAGDYEEALDPLIHALRFESIGPERQAETRAAVVRALEGVAAVRALSIRRLSDAGLRDEAAQSAEKLRTLVNGCRDLGFTENELLAAFARVRRLCEELGMEDPA